MHIADGTYSPTDMTPILKTGGFYVSRPFGRTAPASNHGAVELAIQDIRDRAEDANEYLGVWTANGTVHVDVTHWVINRDNAIGVGWHHSQLAVWDIAGAYAVDVSEPVTDPIDGARIIRRVDGKRGHAFVCSACKVASRGITFEPIRRRMAHHLIGIHDYPVDAWSDDDTHTESATGHTLSVTRDTVGHPNSFGWTWARHDGNGTELATGTAGTESAARVLARMSNA